MEDTIEYTLPHVVGHGDCFLFGKYSDIATLDLAAKELHVHERSGLRTTLRLLKVNGSDAFDKHTKVSHFEYEPF